MFISIGYLYVYTNLDQSQNRINVIANAYLFGKNPQQMFETYIKNAQAEAIAVAMNEIQSATNDLETTTNRLNNESTRLLKKEPEQTLESTSLGMSIQKNVSQLGNALSKIFGEITLKGYMSSDGAIKTVQSLE